MRISDNLMMRHLPKRDLITTFLKRRRVRRAMNRVKLTLLCGFLMFVVLRGASGIAKISTGAADQEDFREIRVDLSSQLVQSTHTGGKGVQDAVSNLLQSEAGDLPAIALPTKKLLDDTNEEIATNVDTTNNVTEIDSNPVTTVVATDKKVIEDASDSNPATIVAVTEKVEDKSDFNPVRTVVAEKVEDRSNSNPVMTVVAKKVEDRSDSNPVTTSVVAEKVKDGSNFNPITTVVAEKVEDGNDSSPVMTDSSSVAPVLVQKEDDLEAMRAELSRLFGRKKRVLDSLTASENPRYTTILDWDEQRVNLNNNVEKKQKILMVTGSQPQACQGEEGDYLLLRLAKNKMDFCRSHGGIEFFYNMAVTEEDMSGFWTKPPLIRRLMLARPDVEWIWWIDSDAVFTDMAFHLPMDNYHDYNLVLPGYHDQVFNDLNWVGLNTGSFLIRNCQWSLDLISAWSPIDWDTTSRNRAGYLFSKTLSQRPDFEADDQSAFVYLITSERDIWENKMYLETAYDLSGYWVMLVDKYEEMVANNERFPLVTHFVGCKPCANRHHYPKDECRQGMERALYFADDQIIKSIGLKHNDFTTSSLRRLPTTHLPYI